MSKGDVHCDGKMRHTDWHLRRLFLLKSEWTDTVSSSALNTLKRRKDHQVQILPLTEDLVKIRNHMVQGLELTLSKRLDLIEVPGKKNRKVLILVTQEAKTALNALVRTREAVGIPERNPFFFASKSLDGYLNSWQAMKAVVDEANVENPMSIS
ncbi:fimbriae recombinase [Plakobranchus ocellatus]|uniref:Fimbriae recombinase n=1 Tax=Plakobranchus ocellatus TaxID=259542 RepID=A0AAV4BS70_9GAST|nr:fimbriae recombinase [Plakobranchus ocellatus]